MLDEQTMLTTTIDRSKTRRVTTAASVAAIAKMAIAIAAGFIAVAAGAEEKTRRRDARPRAPTGGNEVE